jgi:Leucine-rich repeat (LRR) protein
MVQSQALILVSLCLIAAIVSKTRVDTNSTHFQLFTIMIVESNNLVGSLPIELYTLNPLRSINFFANAISGRIPNMSMLSNLREIDLQQNLLTGDAIPLSLPSGLTSYKVSGNKLSGTIPAAIDGWTGLRVLWAGRNEISGTIPTSIGNLFNLESLYLYENNLKGSLPSELGRIPLEEVWLSNNFFETAIPEELLFLGSLTLFRLENNVFSGSLATWIGLLTNLQDLRINNNNLNGQIPSQLGLLTDLGKFDFVCRVIMSWTYCF